MRVCALHGKIKGSVWGYPGEGAPHRSKGAIAEVKVSWRKRECLRQPGLSEMEKKRRKWISHGEHWAPPFSLRVTSTQILGHFNSWLFYSGLDWLQLVMTSTPVHLEQIYWVSEWVRERASAWANTLSSTRQTLLCLCASAAMPSICLQSGLF
jgi:hypothetical protein